MSPTLDEIDQIEILRGADVRVTTLAITVGKDVFPVFGLSDITLVEADHTIRLAPLSMFVAGPILGVAIYLTFGWPVRSLIVAAFFIAMGAMMYRDSWQHQVNARLSNGTSTTLYRTPNLGDARLFHAAAQKAVDIATHPSEEPGSPA
jgi:hypothetical protein